MCTVSFICNNRFLPILESGDLTEIDALLSQLAKMSESELKFLMFSASFPNVSNTIFKSVVCAVLQWGDKFRKAQKRRWVKLRQNKEAFAHAIELAIMDNYILDLMDARLTQQEANQHIGNQTPLHLAVLHKHLYANPNFPELAVIRFLTSSYSLDSTKQCFDQRETAWHRACMKADQSVLRTLAMETHYGSLNIQDRAGDTPLHKLCGVSPCQPHSPEIGECLLALGIDGSAVAKDGKTAADILREELKKRPSEEGEILLSLLQAHVSAVGGASNE